jgi:diguanylate cyclase (GGDEF)-like protein
MRLIRWTTPRGGFDTAFKFLFFMVIIHAVSLTTEYVLVGKIGLPPLTRFALSTLTATPFVALTLFAVHRSYVLHLQLASLASTDMLTGMKNRRAFFAMIENHIAAGNHGYVMIADADHFKDINDTYGHAVGDLCLQAVADRLRDVADTDETVARIGGEEFGMYVRRDPAAIRALGIAVCSPICVTHDPVKQPVCLTLSVGAAAIIPGETLERAMRRADEALYQAKLAGRGALVTWTGPYPLSHDGPVQSHTSFSPAAG